MALSQETGKTPAQIALNWLLRQPGVTAPIIGARTPKQLAENLGATDWALDDDQVGRLNKVSDMDLPYPYDVLRRLRRK